MSSLTTAAFVEDYTETLPAIPPGTEIPMTDDRWSYQLCGAEFGPVPYESLVDLAQGGHLGPEDLVRGPKGNWKPAGDIVGLIPEDVAESAVIELPSIASEDSRARVVAPVDRAVLPTAGPSREQAIGPKPLQPVPRASEKTPAAAQQPAARQPSTQQPRTQQPKSQQKPESMRDALSSMLASAETVSQSDASQQGNVSPQRSATKPIASKPAAGQPVNPVASTPKQPEQKPAASKPAEASPTANSESASSAAGDRSTAETPAPTPAQTAPTPQPPQQPAPYRRPVSIPSSKKGFDFDPDLVKKIGGGIAALVAVGVLVFFGRPLLAGSQPKANLVEAQWNQTDQMAVTLLQIVGAERKDQLPKFSVFAVERSRDIVARLQEATANGTNTDPLLSDEILKLHLEAIPPLMKPEGWTPENIQRLTAAYESAKSAAEG